MTLLSFCLLLLQFIPSTERYAPYSSVGISIARPSNPDYFYDFWKNGYGVTYNRTFPSADPLGWMVAGDMFWYGLDQERVFQRYSIDAGSTALSGGSAVVLTASAYRTYRIPDYTSTVPYLFTGVGLSLSEIFGTTITYPFHTTEQKMQTGVGIFIPIGIIVETKYRETTNIIIIGKYDFGIPILAPSLSGKASISVAFRLD